MNFADIKTVAVLGAGTMGNGIAHVFARSGFKVILRDVEKRFLDRGMETIGKNLDREIKKGKIAEAEKGTVLGRLRPVTDMGAIAVADFVVEAVPEKIEINGAARVLMVHTKTVDEHLTFSGYHRHEAASALSNSGKKPDENDALQ